MAEFNTDGSYMGRQREVFKRHDDLLQRVDKRLNEINEDLKANKTKVSVARRGSALVLKATLPLKPGETHVRDKRQYHIYLGIPANLEGCQTAWEEAVALGTLIARHSFAWNEKYLGTKAQKKITFQEVYDKFEDKYFLYNPKNIKSEGTVKLYKKILRNRFPLDKEISIKNTEDALRKINSPSVLIKVIDVSNLVFRLFDLNGSFGHLRPKNYKPKQRDIPEDRDIIHWHGQFEEFSGYWDKSHGMWLMYQLWYGLMATYSCRPREIIHRPNIQWFLSPENADNTWKVHDLNKTGYREVIPFVPEWVDLFHLKNEKALRLLEERTRDLDHRQLSALCMQQNRYWGRMGIPFKPYDLRHAGAIRAHLQGIPIKLASQNLGHTVAIHTKVYQQWLSLEQRKQGFTEALSKMTEVEALKKEVAELKLENERLRIELERAKLMGYF